MRLSATYFDGQSSAAIRVQVELYESCLTIYPISPADNLQQQTFPRTEVSVSDRLGNIARSIYLPGGAKLEVADNEAIDSWAKNSPGFLFKLESAWRYVFFGLVLLFVFMVGSYQYAIPYGAKYLAHKLPVSVLATMNEDTEKAIEHIFEASQLPHDEQQKWQSLFQKQIPENPGGYDFKLKLYHSLDANAFALPGGTIILTDELIAMAEDDDEVIGVIQHEIGHVVGRHATRHFLQNSAVILVITLLVGDTSSMASILAAAPVLFMQLKYSRDFEYEADAYAADSLHQQGKSVDAFVRILKRITSGQLDLKYLSTHPVTENRLQKIKSKYPDNGQ